MVPQLVTTTLSRAAVKMAAMATKTCASCGRAIEPRRKWRGRLDEVKYCSARCRSRRPGKLDRRLEEAIVEMLARRERGATMCPSEVARAVMPEGLRSQMERTRCAARRLVARAL